MNLGLDDSSARSTVAAQRAIEGTIGTLLKVGDSLGRGKLDPSGN